MSPSYVYFYDEVVNGYFAEQNDFELMINTFKCFRKSLSNNSKATKSMLNKVKQGYNIFVFTGLEKFGRYLYTLVNIRPDKRTKLGYKVDYLSYSYGSFLSSVFTGKGSLSKEKLCDKTIKCIDRKLKNKDNIIIIQCNESKENKNLASFFNYLVDTDKSEFKTKLLSLKQSTNRNYIELIDNLNHTISISKVRIPVYIYKNMAESDINKISIKGSKGLSRIDDMNQAIKMVYSDRVSNNLTKGLGNSDSKCLLSYKYCIVIDGSLQHSKFYKDFTGLSGVLVVNTETSRIILSDVQLNHYKNSVDCEQTALLMGIEALAKLKIKKSDVVFLVEGVPQVLDKLDKYGLNRIVIKSHSGVRLNETMDRILSKVSKWCRDAKESVW